MVIYFCPKCDAKYSTANLESMSNEPGLSGDQVAKHILCHCGYEGGIWPNTVEGRQMFVKMLKNHIQYDEDMIAACITAGSSAEFYQKDKKELEARLKKETGQDIKEKEKAAAFNDAFSAWSNTVVEKHEPTEKGVPWIENNKNYRLVGQTAHFPNNQLNIDYVVLKLKSISYSTLFGDYKQGKAELSEHKIKFSGNFVERDNHTPLLSPIAFTITISTSNGGKWIEKLRSRDKEIIFSKPILRVSDTMEVLDDESIPVNSLTLSLITPKQTLEYSSKEVTGKLQFVNTKEVKHENNIWLKGAFQGGNPFEINIYSQPILETE